MRGVALRLYWVSGALLLLFQLFEAATGWQWEPQRRQEIPQEVRLSSTGYRSYHFWHQGARGGK